MSLLQIFILALVQGLTEFLPISSSAHLILVPAAGDFHDQGLAIDVAAHVGTLTAVILYFRKDISDIFFAWLASLSKRQHSVESRIAWGLLIGSIPLGIGGYLVAKSGLADTVLRSPLVIAWATIGFGLLLGVADWFGKRLRELDTITWPTVILIGFAQVFALIPGTSRSGVTMTTGLLLGLTRSASARFSFLLSIPAIVMVGVYMGSKLFKLPYVDWTPVLLVTVLSALTAYFCIHYFLKLIERMGMTPFVIYRLVLGVILLYVFW